MSMKKSISYSEAIDSDSTYGALSTLPARQVTPSSTAPWLVAAGEHFDFVKDLDLVAGHYLVGLRLCSGFSGTR